MTSKTPTKVQPTSRIRLNADVSPFAARAVGILRGRILPDPAKGARSFNLEITERDGRKNLIPGVMLNSAQRDIIASPLLMVSEVDILCYPRTIGRDLSIQAVAIEKATGRFHPDADFFLISGINLGCRSEGEVKIGVRPNRTKKEQKHHFERFWIRLYGYLKGDLQAFYHLKAVRKGTRLFIVDSNPRLPKQADNREKPSAGSGGP